MFSPASCSLISRCWSRQFGWDEEQGPLWSNPPRVIPHGGDYMDYHDMMVMDTPSGSVISLPQAHLEEFAPVLLAGGTPPTENARNFVSEHVSHVIGPAFIGYAEVVTGTPRHPVQLLGPKEASHLALLQQACDAEEWAHGGSTLDEADAICGVFAGDTLAALAGYEIWDGTVAHISIVTHPEHRGMGYGRSSVAFLARHAAWKKLLPQYRTLEANAPSIAIARDLGFEHFGTSVAVRLKGAAVEG